MNLMKLFNINYLLQNIKKSRTILAIFIGLIPILNTIILIMTLTTNETHIFNFAEISIINIIGIYILPIIISICLFNYIYKKKSVDFINSMPISRKSIFITNTILGIMIFTIMLLINTILIWIVSLIFNSPIPFMMLFNYFWFFLLVYIFTFSATNLAMTISGNAITQIVVTLLLLFLIPFSHLYLKALYYENTNYNILLECTEASCQPEKYYCYDDLNCTLNKELDRYSTYITPVIKANYTIPFNVFYNILSEEHNLINITSIFKTIILSILYIILGYYLFLKRKMEVSETSFKNIHTHNLVKSLTLVPIAAIAYIILRNQEIVFILFVVLLMFIYYIVYDLITKKSFQNIKLASIYFLVTIIILTSVFSIAAKEKETNTILKYNDIKEVSVSVGHYSGRDYNSKIYTSNKELINIVVKSILSQENYEEKNEYYINTYLKTKDNKEYETGISISQENYNKIITLISSEKSYINYYKNIDMNEVYAIKLGNKIYSHEEAEPYLNLIKRSLQKLSLKEYLELQDKYSYIKDNYYIKLYTYENHDKQEIVINSYINYDLLNAIVNSNNGHLKDIITPVIPSDYYLYYENAYLEKDYSIDFYVIKSAKHELYEFILKNIKEEIDMRNEYFTFSIQLNNNTYYFTTNKVEEIKEILDKKYQEIKETNDYKEYYGFYTKEDVEYYD